MPLALTADAPKPGELTLIGIPDPKEQNGNRKLTEIKARLIDGSAIELRQPVPMAGFSGAAALDGQGRFLGMMEMRSAVLASIEPAAPPVRLIGAATIRGFLDAHHVAAPSAYRRRQGVGGADYLRKEVARRDNSPPHPEEHREAMRLEGWGGRMVRDGASRLLTMRPR